MVVTGNYSLYALQVALHFCNN